jgi:hypothetical protein
MGFAKALDGSSGAKDFAAGTVAGGALGLETSGEKAAKKAGRLQAASAGEASALLDPFASLGQTGVQQAGFLTDPNAQFDFVQNNPFYNAALEQGNRALTDTTQFAASQGRLTAGDTLQQLQSQGQNNALLASQPLVAGQKQSIADLINLGFGATASQGNLLTDQAAATAGGLVGAANARADSQQNIFDLAGKVAGGL